MIAAFFLLFFVLELLLLPLVPGPSRRKSLHLLRDWPGGNLWRLVLFNFTLLAPGVNSREIFLFFREWLGRPSSQTTITAGGALTRGVFCPHSLYRSLVVAHHCQ